MLRRSWEPVAWRWRAFRRDDSHGCRRFKIFRSGVMARISWCRGIFEMFTGIIEHLGRIESLKRSEAGGRLRINLRGAASIASDLKIGSSIAVNGCCLTAVEIGNEFFSADLSAETLQRTSFAEADDGSTVNLELPLAAGAQLGGHFVQGHI